MHIPVELNVLDLLMLIFYLSEELLSHFFFFFLPDDFVGNRDLSVSERNNKLLRNQMTEDEKVEWYHQLNRHEFEQL